MTVEGSDVDLAKAYLELQKGEKTADQLERMLDRIEAKVDALITSEELQELERLQEELKSNVQSTDDILEEKTGEEKQ
ncbi:hypothetical protein TRVA0_021S01090 [Trichomonascus vanleenenianus]|uniref:uncharacterized protein n=1 Tax=Trichomonascus vanleenenianus TaxID=2268995 RepID=UPI003ECA7A4B